MSNEAHLDSATLTVLLDIRHPFCHLALPEAVAFGRARGIEINWLPVAVQTLRPPSARSAGDDRSIRHKRNRAEMIAREIDVYSSLQGLELVDYYRDPDATAVHQAWLWVREHSPESLEDFLSIVFRAYGSEGLDPGDLRAVSLLVEKVLGDGSGAAFSTWASSAGVKVAQSLASDLEARGLSGAPLYEVAGQIFMGRQHLRMIEWILEGERGPGPI